MSEIDLLLSSLSNQRLFQQESMILESTECIARAMSKEEINKSELAERLGKSVPFVSQTLSGSRNMTFRTFADILFVMGYTAILREQRLDSESSTFSANNFYAYTISNPLQAEELKIDQRVS